MSDTAYTSEEQKTMSKCKLAKTSYCFGLGVTQAEVKN
jgi:hypothetical protein